MAKFIVHLESDTIVPMDECLLLDFENVPDRVMDDFTGDDYFDDLIALKVARVYGKPLVQMGGE